MLSKIRKVISLIIMIAIVIGVFPIANSQKLKADTVYYIYTVEDLYDVRNHLSATCYLMNDIDLTDATASDGDYDYKGQGWKPIGAGDDYKTGKAFSGTFDGQGHTIKGMTIKNIDISQTSLSPTVDGRLGLFWGLSGTIKNLTVGGSISGGAASIGGIAGKSSGKLVNCINKVNIRVSYSGRYGTTAVGGIVGRTEGTVSFCSNYGTINGESINHYSYSYFGGIVGFSESNIDSCYNAADIKNNGTCTEMLIAGIAGIANNVTNCYNTATIYNGKGLDRGSSGSKINGSYGIARVSGTVNKCYNMGDVKHYAYYYGSGSSTSYEISDTLQRYTKREYAVSNLGNNSYYLNDISNGSGGVGTPMTDNQMKMQSLYNGFDFTGTWIMDSNCVYKYPQLRYNRQYNNKEINSIEIENLPNKTTYSTGEILDLTGGSIKVYYVDGSYEHMDMNTDMLTFTPSGYNSPGTFGVYLYPDKIENPGKSAHFSVTVVKRTATLLTLLSEPTVREFVQNTTFDFTGCQVQIAYDNGDIETRDIKESMTTGGDITKLGTQTIKYSLDSLSVQFNIRVIPLSVTSIKIETKPKKLTYLEGKDFDPTGMTVRAYLNDGSDRLVEDYTYSGYSSEPGIHTITVEYSGCTDTFDVEVNEKTATSIKVTKNPTKTTYIQGQEVDPDGMEVTAYYNNGTNSVITGYTIDKPTMDTGVQTVAVRYGNLVTYIPVTVIARQATGLFVTTPPNKTTYIEGTEFDDTGLVVAASFNDGITESIDDYELAGVDTSTVGNKVVTVMYQGFTTTFDINVVAKSLESIKITDKGKDSYLVGEELDTSDLVVVAYYDNGTHEKITDYEVSGFTGNVGDNVITVNYQGKKINYVVKVHNPDDEWTVTKEPTCTEKGERVKYCKYCGEVSIKEDIDKLGHTSVPDLAKDATCTETGLTAGSHCGTCGEILVAQEVIPAKGHTPSEEWEMIKDSTCLDEGSQVRRCAVCHEIVDTNAIVAKGHKLVTDEAVEATCTESGLTEGLHCEVCDEVIQAQTIIQPLGHIEAEEWTVTKAPTCTVAGTKVKKCTVCGHILKTEIIDPTGHSFKNYVSNNDATCTEDGTKTAKCEHCSETKTITDVNSAKGHKVVYDKAVAATCTESGLTAGSHCSECHEILQRQEVIAPKGHTASSKWVIAKQPTCTEKGIEVCQCVECDEVLDSRKIEAKGHTEVVDATVVATCTESGLTAGSHCHVCGEILVVQEVIPAKGHKEVIDKSVDATCEKTGLTQGSHCEVCGEVLKKQEIIPAKGHNVELKHVSKATYFDEGYTGDEVCNICGQVLKRGKTINKLQVPKPIVKFKKGKKRITLKFTKQKKITKYEIRIKKGKKWKVYYTSKSSYKIKKLKKKRKYTVKVRAMIVRGKDIAYSRYILKKVKTK